MNVIVDGKAHTGNNLRVAEDHLFLDDKDLGQCENTSFRVSTINGEVCFVQWNVIEGGLNV